MKKKTPLIFLLAALSTAAVGAVAGCDNTNTPTPDGGHTHNYTWKSDDNQHWQECPDDGAKTTPADHVDTDGNGVCDVCSHKYSYNVTFDMHGHGTAPAAQKVEHGNKASEPTLDAAEIAALLKDGWEFDGWYTDDTFKTKFDFTADVTAAKVAHAHWVEVDYTKDPVVLELGKSNLTKFTGKKLYFTFTAADAGRYTVRMQAENGCTFIVDATDADNKLVTETEGKIYHFTLAKDETVGILVSKPDTWNDDTSVSPIVSECINEPLPADGWIEGVYSNESFSVDFKRDGTLKINDDEDSLSYTYVDGAVYFSKTFDVGVTVTNNYKMTQTADKEITVVLSGGSSATYVLKFEEPVEPIPVLKFSGKYELKDGEVAVNKVATLNINDDGSGYVVASGNYRTTYKLGVNGGAVYDASTNTLKWGSLYTITVNLDKDGNAESVILKIMMGDVKTAVYERKGDADNLPFEMPLALDSEYVGGDYSILTDTYGQKLNGYTLTITAKDGDTYSFSANDKSYKAKLIKTDDKVTSIELYGDDDTLLTTLVPLVYEFHDLPTDGEDVTLAKADFIKDFYYFTVATEGWYEIKVTNATYVYYNMTESNLTWSNDVLGGGAVKIDGGTLIGIYAEGSDDVVFSIKKVDAPLGLDEDNPVVLTDGSGTFVGPDSKNVYYFAYTAPAAGKYIVNCVGLTASGDTTYTIHYVANNTEGGYSYKTYKWAEGCSADKPWISIDVPADNLEVLIAVDVLGSWAAPASLTVSLIEDYSDGTALALNADNNFSGDITASGKYKFNAVEGLEGVTLKSDEDFTVSCGGVTQTVKEFTLQAMQLAFGFKIEVAAGSTVAYKGAFVEGSQYNPVKADDIGTYEVAVGNYVTITLPSTVTSAVVSIQDVKDYYDTVKFCFYYNDTQYGYTGSLDWDTWSSVWTACEAGTSLTLHGGDSVTILIGYDNEGAEYSSNVTLVVMEDLTAGATALEFSGSGDSYSATATVAGGKNFLVADTNGGNLVISASSAFSVLTTDGNEHVANPLDGVYSVTLNGGKNVYFKVIAETETAFTFTTPYPLGSEKNPFDIVFEQGEYSYNIDGGSTVAFKFGEDGAFVLTVSNATATLNGTAVESGEITVSADDVLVVTANADGGALKVSIVPQFTDEAGKYESEDDSFKLDFNEYGFGSLYVENYGTSFEVTVIKSEEEGVYNLLSDQLRNCSFTFDADGNIELTIFKNTVTLYTPENKPEPAPAVTFTADQAGTYSGKDSDGYTLTLTLNEDGTATFNDGMSDNDVVSIILNGDVYSCSFGTDSFTFKFVEGNVLVTFYGSDTTLVKGAVVDPDPDPNPNPDPAPTVTFTADQAGTYSGVDSENYTLVLTLNTDGTGTFNAGTGNAEEFDSLSLDEGVYYCTTVGMTSFTFKFVEGNVVVTAFGANTTLTKSAS